MATAHAAFNTLVDAAVGQLRGASDQLADAGLAFRTATAGGFEAAVGSAAAAAAQAQLAAVLAVAPRLPFATAHSVCDAFEDAIGATADLLPAALTAAVMGSDAGVAALAVGLLVDEQALAQALNDEFDSVEALLAATQASGHQLAQALQQATAPAAGLMQTGQAARTLVDAARAPAEGAGNVAMVLASAVGRLHAAARQGVLAVHAAAAPQLQALRDGRTARAFAGRAGQRVSLDREYTGVVPGSVAVLSTPSRTQLFKVGSVAHAARAEFAISGKSTALSLSGQHLSDFASAVRDTTVHVHSEALARARTPLATPIEGATIPVAADVAGMPAGRRLIVKGPRVADGSVLVHSTTLVSATPAANPADGGTLAIDPPLPEALRRDGTVVYGNVVLASHGETVAQLLGAGQAAEPFQRFELKHAPLTYRAADNETGAASTVSVRVGDVEWRERSTLYGAGADDRSYTLVTDEQSRTWVQFGDGSRGARPATGVNNVRARYRKGIGVEGNVAAETLTQPAVRPLGLKSVANPAAALGGTEPEARDAARQRIPLQTRTLGRAVSVLDYEDFARAYAGVAKARADVLALRGGPTVCVTVAGTDGEVLSPSHPVWQHLLAALRASGDPHVPLRLLAHAACVFRIGLKVKVDPAYDDDAVLSAVDAALRARYAFETRALGQPVHQSDVVATVHAVPGVLATDLDFLYGGSAPFAQTLKSRQLRLLARRMQVQAGEPTPDEILTLADGPLDRLEVMA